ncbi:MAG: hypothetical protein L0211_25515 [Planctomycetaceae bacterium]|nr:hypothetical protein [Planctomycetaceae bacterium]
MASVTIGHDVAVERPVESLPAWWRRGHSFAFMAVAAAEVGLTWGVARLAESSYNLAPGFENVATAGIFGFLFAQCFLLGLWAALGGLATVPRWLAVGAVSTIGALAVTCELIAPHWQEFLNQGPIMAVLAGLTMAGFAVVLLPLRRLAGWRVDFDAAYHPSTGHRRGQLGLMDFAAMFCAVALPLTLGRAMIELMGEDAAEFGIMVPIFVALVLASAGPAAYAVLARRGAWITLPLCLIWLLAVCLFQSILAASFPDLDLFDGRTRVWGVNWTVFAFHLGVAATVALPLGVLRWFGLELIAVK